MSEFDRLKPKEQRGSKPRCHLLTHGSAEEVATRLTGLIAPFASVNPNDRWMPQGFEHTAEAMLPEAERLLPADVRLELQRWWLSVLSKNARTPNWDIASTCTIDGKTGILLIEAKAHDQELIKEETGRKNIETPVSEGGRRNLLRIDWAIRDASVALSESTGLPWALSRDWNYQMSNRFAWAWKLTDLGIPVVLVYLGFLGASEMQDRGKPFADAGDWEKIVRHHSKALFPAEVWGKPWVLGERPFIPLIRSLEILLKVGSEGPRWPIPTDEQLLDGDKVEGWWERAPVDEQWWRLQSLPFPAAPIKGTDILIPISSVEDLIRKHQDFGIQLDNFWMRSVLSPSWESAYFFKWCGRVPAIVLTIFGNNHLARVECLGRGDQPMPNRSEIVESAIKAFAAAGFDVREARSKEN